MDEETSAASLARDDGDLGQQRALGRPQRQSQQDWLVGWSGEQKKEAVPHTPVLQEPGPLEGRLKVKVEKPACGAGVRKTGVRFGPCRAWVAPLLTWR